MAREVSGQLKWWGTRYSVRVRFADGKARVVPLPPELSNADALERAADVARRARLEAKPENVSVLVSGGETVADWCLSVSRCPPRSVMGAGEPARCAFGVARRRPSHAGSRARAGQRTVAPTGVPASGRRGSTVA